MLNRNTIISTIIAVICLGVITFFLYGKYSVKTVEYTGLGSSDNSEEVVVKKDIIVTSDVRNSDKIEFTQRKITGGGTNPGWVISLLETQPNIFTGRVIVDDGVYQHPVNVKEEVTDIFVGEMKSKTGKKEIFSMKKQNKSCKDEEGNIFEYTLSGTYGATQFSGCGGDVLEAVE
jgi:predicted metal-dependent peptidase